MSGFDWALVQMRAGKKVRRKGWLPEEWIALSRNRIVDEDGAETQISNQKALLALDWEPATLKDKEA